MSCLSLTHHDELRRKEKRVGLAVNRFRPEVEFLHRAGEPLKLGQEAREVESEHAREEKRADEPLPCLQTSKQWRCTRFHENGNKQIKSALPEVDKLHQRVDRNMTQGLRFSGKHGLPARAKDNSQPTS